MQGKFILHAVCLLPMLLLVKTYSALKKYHTSILFLLSELGFLWVPTQKEGLCLGSRWMSRLIVNGWNYGLVNLTANSEGWIYDQNGSEVISLGSDPGINFRVRRTSTTHLELWFCTKTKVKVVPISGKIFDVLTYFRVKHEMYKQRCVLLVVGLWSHGQLQNLISCWHFYVTK